MDTTIKEMNTMYNGWKNYQTWNVALWINNDEFFYRLASKHDTYSDFVEELREMHIIISTPDKVSFSDMDLDYEALNEVIKEI